jgi:hypothetical protein
MALSTALPLLVADLEALLLELSQAEDAAAARQTYAQKLAQAIHNYTTAAVVLTNGSATTQTGTLK